jgi:dolichol-phosphate mannosyltransferase
MDADGEDPANLLSDFYESLVGGTEIAYGVRENRSEATYLQWVRKLFYRFLARISDDPFLRNVGEFSMFTKNVRDSILKENNSYPFWRSSLARMGFRGQGFPHSRNPRIAGKSKLNKRAMFQFAIGGILSTTTSPLRFCAYLLLGISISNTVASVSLLTNLIGVKTFFAIAVLSIACIGFALSIMAIYQARIYKNLLFRPNYFIDFDNSRIAKNLQSHGWPIANGLQPKVKGPL